MLGLLKFAFGSPLILAIVITAVVSAVGIHLWHDHGVKKERDKALQEQVRLETEVSGLVQTLANNEIELAECVAINAANDAAALRVTERLATAVSDLEKAKQATATAEARITHEAETFDNDMDCPAFTDDFRQWMWHTAGQDRDSIPDH